MKKSGNSPRDSKAAVLSAARWLVRSGIQSASKDLKRSGGVAAWYEPDKKRYPFLYSEITGYALSTWVFANRIHPSAEFLKAANQAAGWLVKNALYKDGGVKTRFYLVKRYVSPNYCFHYGRVYAFDAAMVGYGLLQLFKVSKKEEHLRAAERVLQFLTTKMMKKGGSFYPYFDSSTQKCGEDLDKWSDQEGSFHGKLALFFTDYYRLTGIEKYRQITFNLLDGIKKQQKSAGRFITGKKDGSTHLHPHSYTLEGLLYAGILLKRPDYCQAALKGFLWMVRGVSTDGSVSSILEKNKFSRHERSDIVAQFLRIGSILYTLYPKKISAHLETLESVKKHLLLFQNKDASRQSGGFLYGAATDGLMRPHLNAWATQFALQALWMHDEFVLRRRPVCVESFV